MIETKDFGLKLIKELTEDGSFTAYATRYGLPDLVNDVIEKGAFNQSIAKQGDGYPLLWAHQTETPIGTFKLSDSERGPIVHASLDLDDEDGLRAYKRLKKRIVKAVSIGFTLPNSQAVKWDGGIKRIHEIRLHEVSLVTIPAQTGATVISVRSLGDAARVLDGFQVETLGAAELESLVMIQKHVNRLLAGREEPAPDAAILADLRDLAKALRPN